MFSLVCQADFNQGVAAYKLSDYAGALKIWQKIAKQKPSKKLSKNEIREAQYSLALLYWQGQGVKQNYQQTEKWLLLAANQGHSEAQSKLGNLYLLGLTGQVNTDKARYWFEKSAQQGNVNGQYNLGVLYLDGVGIAKDPELAKKWLEDAVKQGDSSAKQLLVEAEAASKQSLSEKPTMPPGSVIPTSETQQVFSNVEQNKIQTPISPEQDMELTIAPTATDYYAIQLFSSTNQTEALGFIETWQTQLQPLISADKMKKSQQFFIVVYGHYSSSAEAKQAITDLPTELKKNRPWVIKMRGNSLAP